MGADDNQVRASLFSGFQDFLIGRPHCHDMADLIVAVSPKHSFGETIQSLFGLGNGFIGVAGLKKAADHAHAEITNHGDNIQLSSVHRSQYDGDFQDFGFDLRLADIDSA
jgi:hypothetical protein